VRHDVPVLTDLSTSSLTSASSPAKSAQVATARACAWAWAWLAVLGLLVATTCLTVAVYASDWLVAPYLVVLTLILGVPEGLRLRARALAGRLARVAARRGRQASGGAATASWARRSRRPGGLSARRNLAPETSETANAARADEPSAPLPDALGTKPRRGRGRGRKAKAGPALEPAGVTATWVRVGPGKFVRTDAPVLPVEPDTETRDRPDLASEPEPGPGPLAAGATGRGAHELAELLSEAAAAHDADPAGARSGGNAQDDRPADPVREPELGDGVGPGASDDVGPLPDRGPAARVEDVQEDNGNTPDASRAFAASVPAEGPRAGLDGVVTASPPRCEVGPGPMVVADVLPCGSTATAVDGRSLRRAPGAPPAGYRRQVRGRGPSRTAAPAPVVPRWNARAGRISRVFPGFVRLARARRNLRHSGRFHHADRTLPPRSPPAVAM
jgi:hypothetical protein